MRALRAARRVALPRRPALARPPQPRHRRRVGAGVAAAAAAGGAGAALCCEPHPARCSGEPGSPFDDPELAAAAPRRVLSEQRLTEYMRTTQQILGALQLQLRTGSLGETPEAATEAYWARMRELQAEVELQSQRILYGVEEPGARAAYEAAYGCARWTEPALKVLVGLSPLVEIGAGAGHWQREVAARGGDLLAFESGEEVPLPQRVAVGEVRDGDHTMAAQHADRTLFLCYPPAGPMAAECLRLYKGERLVYVGEGRGGVNASPHFFAVRNFD